MRGLSNASLAVAITYPLAGTKDKSSLGKQECVLAFAPELADFSGRKELEKETWVELRSSDTTNPGGAISPEAPRWFPKSLLRVQSLVRLLLHLQLGSDDLEP